MLYLPLRARQRPLARARNTLGENGTVVGVRESGCACTDGTLLASELQKLIWRERESDGVVEREVERGARRAKPKYRNRKLRMEI